MLEIGPERQDGRGCARPIAPGLERGAKTAAGAIDRLAAYRPRYARIASLASMDKEFASTPTIDVVEHYPGSGSTDFWGISFAISSSDRQDVSSDELARELLLMQASWAFFDEVRTRVSADLQQGPRGGGRHRDRIVRHVVHTQQDWGKKLGLPRDEGATLSDEALKTHRDAYCAAIRAFHTQGKLARTWPLRYLIRHTAYHTLDHAWEMEDRDPDSERDVSTARQARRNF